MKAELFSSDFMISMFLFISVLVIITMYYQNLQTDVYEADMRNDMYSKAMDIASLLATTSGYPKYWDNNTVKIIGLYDAGKFNLTKFEYLMNTSYQDAKIKLGTGFYNFNITLKNITGQIIQRPGISYTCGSSIDTAEQIILVKRLGMINLQGDSTKTIMEVILWI